VPQGGTPTRQRTGAPLLQATRSRERDMRTRPRDVEEGCGTLNQGQPRRGDLLAKTRHTPPIFFPVAKGNSTLCDLSV
jgi:hypothetical protein